MTCLKKGSKLIRHVKGVFIMKRKTIFVTSLFTVILLLLTGCGMKRESVSEGKCKVVTTIFPPYDFVREIAGD